MRLDPETAPTARDCKLKRVHPRLPLHVHSAGQERVARTGSGNPTAKEGPRPRSTGTSEWSAHRLRIRLEHELSAEAWRRLETVALRRGTNVEALLCAALAEAS